MLTHIYRMHLTNMVEKTGVKYNTIQKRLKNPNFPNYYYVKFGAIPPKELSYNHDN